MRFTKERRHSLSKILYDFARLTFAGLVLGQIIASEKFKPWVFVAGIVSVMVFIFIGLFLENGGDQ